MQVFEGELWIRPGQIIRRGRLLEEGGRILAAGALEEVDIPAGARVWRFDKGEKILPGFLEVHCHLGLYEEVTGKDRLNAPERLLAPDYRAASQVNPQDLGFYSAALEGGVTTACILPGSAALVGGTGCILKTGGRTGFLQEDCCLKASLGENVEKAHKRTGEELRQLLKAYLLEHPGNLPLRIHAHREADIRGALEALRSSGWLGSLEHGTEGWLLLPELREAGVPVVAGPFFVGRPKEEMRRPARNLPRLLREEGVPTYLMSDFPSNPPDMLRITLLEAIRQGVGQVEALEMVTTRAAAFLGVEGRVGSLEPGKDADLVIHSHGPFQYDDQILQVFIEGVEIAWPKGYSE